MADMLLGVEPELGLMGTQINGIAPHSIPFHLILLTIKSCIVEVFPHHVNIVYCYLFADVILNHLHLKMITKACTEDPNDYS